MQTENLDLILHGETLELWRSLDSPQAIQSYLDSFFFHLPVCSSFA